MNDKNQKVLEALKNSTRKLCKLIMHTADYEILHAHLKRWAYQTLKQINE